MISQKSFQADAGLGSLYLVGTPIGNLEDITFRAVRLLKEADWIAAEDTRQTRKLLSHFQISTKLVSYHEHNKHTSGPELIRLMLDGNSIALVSDAGLPAISDPGYELVKSAVENGISVIPIPGPNAALCALIASGLSTLHFMFIGFLPRDKKVLISELERLKPLKETLLFYESPHRLAKTLIMMEQVWGERRICLAREITKKYEEFTRGTISQCLEYLGQYPPKGEYCILVEGRSGSQMDDHAVWWEPFTVSQHVEHYVSQGMTEKDAMKKAAADRNIPKREIYNEIKKYP